MRRHHDLGFLLIAIFKLVKAVVLTAVGCGALSLFNPTVAEIFREWAQALLLQTDRRFLQDLLLKVGLINHRDLVITAAVAFGYAGLVFAEGFGLYFEKVWAEYLTAIITVSFIPVEIYQLIRHVSASRIGLLIVNSLVVVYLARRLRQRAVGVTQKSAPAAPGEN